jgi:hemoglobin
MVKDIESRIDIETIVNQFYDKVRADEVIGFIFTDIAKVNWEAHLPIMYDFWEFTALGTGSFNRNAMTPHFELNEKIKLMPEHFERWLKLFNETVDELFAGKNADNMKGRAQNIARLMEHKLNDMNQLRIV